LGDALLKSNSVADADTIYREVLRRAAGDRDALLGLARCDLQSGRLTAARSHLQQAVAGHPDFASAQSLLATVFERLGNPEAAEVARERVQRGGHYTESPDPWEDDLIYDCHNPYTLVIAASSAVADGNPARAKTLLERGLTLAPDDARLHRQLGKTLEILDYAAGARREMEKASALDPTNDAIRLDHLAILRRAQDSAAIERALREGLTACPNSAGLHFEAGVVAAKSGRLEEAAKHLEFSWRNGPDQSAAGLELAAVYFQNGRQEDGVAVLEDVLKRHPQEHSALVILIRHGLEMGDQVRTANWLQRAMAAHAPANLMAELRQNYERRFGAAMP
jgi:Flp pilus assembly protein TadD